VTRRELIDEQFDVLYAYADRKKDDELKLILTISATKINSKDITGAHDKIRHAYKIFVKKEYVKIILGTLIVLSSLFGVFSAIQKVMEIM
jgi:hypothetical protein